MAPDSAEPVPQQLRRWREKVGRVPRRPRQTWCPAIRTPRTWTRT